jgi:histidine triad (HIT) family protein
MQKPDCIFCQIAAGLAPSHTIWEDDRHIAFLSIFPNTLGFSVVTTKEHFGSYAFAQTDEVIANLMLATKQVAHVLTDYFEDAARCGMFLEGYGVDHLHSKLFPMHGSGEFGETASMEHARPDVYFDKYPGYLSSHDYQRADDQDLAELAEKIKARQLEG